MINCSNEIMDPSDIRRAKLKAMVEAEGLSVVAKKFKKPDRQINDMIAGRKSFGEKVARSMEENYAPNSPRGWLDETDNSITLSVEDRELLNLMRLVAKLPEGQRKALKSFFDAGNESEKENPNDEDSNGGKKKRGFPK